MEERIIPMQSETIGELAKALSNFQGSVQQPKLNKTVSVKTKTGGSYNFKYADLGACMAAAAPTLKENGLAVIQSIQGQTLVTTLSHSSGEFINSQLPLNQNTLYSNDFQSIGSMITYLKRYAYCAILGIFADEDDDANAACANQVQYIEKGQQAASTQQTASKGVTGPQMKKIITEINGTQSIDELVAYWQNLYNEHPELKGNQQLNGTLFQKASNLGIAELEQCKNNDDIEILIQRWTDIWPATIQANTPFGNAIVQKRNTIAA